MKHFYTLFAALLCLTFFAPSVSAQLRVDVTQGTRKAIPIALPQFDVTGSAISKEAKAFIDVIGSNLTRSGMFRVVRKDAYIEQQSSASKQPRFSDWRQIGAHALLTGSVDPAQKPGHFTVRFRLWDVLTGRQTAGQSFTITLRSWRRVAHLMSDIIYTRMTGEAPYFDSRIIFVAETGDKRRPTKRLAIMDQDGANVKYLTSGKYLSMTPRFNPTTQQLIYLSYVNRQPRVYIYDLPTGKSVVLGDFPGMSFAPRFSPDGSKAVLSASLNGNSEIYVMDLKSGRKKRLTNHPAIDTSPSYSPDMKQIVFNSSRQGSQQLYVMESDGDNVRRISHSSGTYGTPVWSPRGDLIAFTKMRKGEFHIGVMRPDGSGERLLTKGYLVEGPTWSPNGRVIIYSRQERRNGRSTPSELWSVDLTGYNDQRIPTPTEASDPAWSPLLSK